MKGTPIKKLFPPVKEDEVGFMIVKFHASNPSELPIADAEGNFIVKGPLLPYSTAGEIELIGSVQGDCFLCSAYDEKLDSPERIKGFFSTLEGYKPSDYDRLWNILGPKMIAKLDINPELLLSCGLPEYRAKKFSMAYAIRRPKKSAIMYLLEKKVPSDDALKIAFACDSLLDLKTRPFYFSLTTILPYKTAKKIAKEEKLSIDSGDGIKAAMLDILRQGEGSSAGRAFEDETVGNTYCTISELLVKTAALTHLEEDDKALKKALVELVQDRICTCAQKKYIYRKETSDAEYGIAQEALRLRNVQVPFIDFVEDIYRTENAKKMRLAPEQRAAVKTILNNSFSLLIGGPGTGKTSIETFVISVYRHYHPDTPILLVAPTGKAARRMSESTGETACTVHKALGVEAGDEVLMSDVMLNAGLVIVDEASMLDSQVSVALFKAIPAGTQVVLVGDTNQLPSVGAGNVLAELIASDAFAITRLETVYRQKDGSTIATNCAKIKHGTLELDYSDTFIFNSCDNADDAVGAILQAYQAELDSGLSIEDICVLSPYRKTTKTGVNNLNPLIQQMVVKPGTPSINYGKTTFYQGDKVMAMTNQGEVANGDVGYLEIIDGSHFAVDFHDGRKVKYGKNDLRNFELAYACTIHKSQGSEYKSCIIVLMDEHKTMLKRNLVYTAVSRAKSQIFLVGQASALQTAILTEDVSRRLSRLAEIIKIMDVTEKTEKSA